MTNRRPYSEPRSVDDALEELFHWKGKQFDGELVELMDQLLRSGRLLGRITLH
jgi:HD-GYP domain-containing protein (c-di-GMP phosphodiesterase class II)